MSLTASFGHSFVTAFERTTHPHRARPRSDIVSPTRSVPKPLPPVPVDISANLAHYRRQVPSGDLLRTMLVGFNQR
jgi:hypothetical protein